MASASASGTPVSRTDSSTSAPLKASNLENPLTRSAEGHHFVADTLRADNGSQGFVLSGAAHYGRGKVPPQATQTAAVQWYAQRSLKPGVVGPVSLPPSPSGLGKRDTSEDPSRSDDNPAATTRSKPDVTEIRPLAVPRLEPSSVAPPPRPYPPQTSAPYEPVSSPPPYHMYLPHPFASGLRGGDASGSNSQLPRELDRSVGVSGAEGGYYPHAVGPYAYDTATGTYVPMWPRWPGPGYVGMPPGSSRFVPGPSSLSSMRPGQLDGHFPTPDRPDSREATTPSSAPSTGGDGVAGSGVGDGNGDAAGAHRPQYRCGQCGEVKRGHFCTVKYKS